MMIYYNIVRVYTFQYDDVVGHFHDLHSTYNIKTSSSTAKDRVNIRKEVDV